MDEAANRNASSLILDLRGNEGGDDVGNEILPHLIDAPITLSSMRRLVRYRKVPNELNPYLDTWDNSFRDWDGSAKELPAPWPTAPAGVTYLKLNRYDDDASGNVIKPVGKRFRGRVIVLIDATNSSATFQFAQIIQMHKLGTLVGEPTGGSQRGINGGAFFFLRLPHSGIEMDLPLIGTFPVTPGPDAGVTPDILVKTTAADIATGQDAVLIAAMRALRK
jgi:C-terminal processing protease CtpA/Prc